jgi:hypothetical protein
MDNLLATVMGEQIVTAMRGIPVPKNGSGPIVRGRRILTAFLVAMLLEGCGAVSGIRTLPEFVDASRLDGDAEVALVINTRDLPIGESAGVVIAEFDAKRDAWGGNCDHQNRRDIVQYQQNGDGMYFFRVPSGDYLITFGQSSKKWRNPVYTFTVATGEMAYMGRYVFAGPGDELKRRELPDRCSHDPECAALRSMRATPVVPHPDAVGMFMCGT